MVASQEAYEESCVIEYSSVVITVTKYWRLGTFKESLYFLAQLWHYPLPDIFSVPSLLYYMLGAGTKGNDYMLRQAGIVLGGTRLVL